MVRAMALPAKSIENDVLLFEPVEMGLFVESRNAMVGQLGEVHGKKLSILAHRAFTGGATFGQ